jgi:hypothetical protein
MMHPKIRPLGAAFWGAAIGALWSALPAVLPAAEVDDTAEHTVVVVEAHESLWSLSAKLLNDPWLWPLLFCDNRDSVRNPELIEVGQTLRYRTDYTPQEKDSATRLAWKFTPENADLQLCPEVKAREAAVAKALKPAPNPTPVPAPASVGAPSREGAGLWVGAGWPEVKVRWGFEAPLDVELKAEFGAGMQVGALRGYWIARSWRGPVPLDLTLGLEGGMMHMGGDGLASGDGFHGLAFAGLEIPLGSRFRVSADLGPGYYSVFSGGASAADWEWVVTTGIYVRLF